MNVHREVSTPGNHPIPAHPLRQLFHAQSAVAFSGPSMAEQRQARRGSAPTEQTRGFHDYEASLENTDRAPAAATRHLNGDFSPPADLNSLNNAMNTLGIVVTYDYPRTMTLSSLSSSFSSSPGSSAGEARQDVKGAAVFLEHPPAMAPWSSGEAPGTNETEPRTHPGAVNVRDINDLLRSHKQQRGSATVDGHLHPPGMWEYDGQADPERACPETTMDEQLHPVEPWEYYGQTDPERACSDTRAVAGSDSLEWEPRHADEVDW